MSQSARLTWTKMVGGGSLGEFDFFECLLKPQQPVTLCTSLAFCNRLAVT